VRGKLAGIGSYNLSGIRKPAPNRICTLGQEFDGHSPAIQLTSDIGRRAEAREGIQDQISWDRELRDDGPGK